MAIKRRWEISLKDTWVDRWGDGPLRLARGKNHRLTCHHQGRLSGEYYPPTLCLFKIRADSCEVMYHPSAGIASTYQPLNRGLRVMAPAYQLRIH